MGAATIIPAAVALTQANMQQQANKKQGRIAAAMGEAPSANYQASPVSSKLIEILGQQVASKYAKKPNETLPQEDNLNMPIVDIDPNQYDTWKGRY